MQNCVIYIAKKTHQDKISFIFSRFLFSSPQQSQDVTDNALRVAGFGLQSSTSAATSSSSATPSVNVVSTVASKYNRRSERRLSLTANPKLNTIHEPNGSSSLTPAPGTADQDPTNTLSSKSRSVSLMDGKIL